MRFRCLLLISGLALVCLCGGLVTRANAATLIVTSTGDTQVGLPGCSDGCSLREAINTASTGDTINFTGLPADSTITLASQIVFPVINLTIDASASNTITVTAAANSRVFQMDNLGARTISMSNLRITGGSLTTSGAFGAGISFEGSGSLTLTNCTVSGNSLTNATGGQGAGIYIGAAGAVLNLNSSTVSGNSIAGSNGQGAGIWIGATSTFANSTISGNTVSGAGSQGGGLWINNSVGGFSINHLTIANNSAVSSGGGVFGPGFSTGSIRNTIIAANTSPGTGPDIAGTFTSDGYNLIGIGNGSSGFVNGTNADQVGSTGSPINPNLNTLANSGGPTLTHSLASGSPAIDKGKFFAGLGSITDQRNLLRPVDQPSTPNAAGGDGSDIGSYEMQLATAAGSMIVGRVLRSDGRAIVRATLTLEGNGLELPRVVLTNPFGYYRFDNVPSGFNYFVTVSSKQYSFSPSSRIVNVNGDTADFDFIAEPPPASRVIDTVRTVPR